MNNPIVKQLVRGARDYAREARRSAYSKDYWRGMSRGQLAAARTVAHAAYGARWCNARLARQATTWESVATARLAPQAATWGDVA